MSFQVGDVIRVVQYDESIVIDTKGRSHEISRIPLVGMTGEVLHSLNCVDRENLSVRINNLFPGQERSKILLWSTEVELVHRPVSVEQLALLKELEP